MKYSKITTAVIAAIMLIFLFYGIVRFPDGPIHPCGISKYCGKQGQPHTLEQYRAFKTWETTLLYMWPVGLLSLVVLNRSRWRKSPLT